MDPASGQTPQQPPTPNPQSSPQPPVANNMQPAPTAPGAPPQQAAHNPGTTLGIISIVTAVIGLGLVGLVLSIIGMKQSKSAGMKNTPAVVGLVLSILSIVIGAVIIGFVILGASHVVQKCQELGPGTHYENGVEYTCGPSEFEN